MPVCSHPSKPQLERRRFPCTLDVVSISVVSMIAACSTPAASLREDACRAGAPAVDTTCAPRDVLVITSDYASSAVGGFSFDGTSKLLAGVDLGLDPALAVSAGRTFFVARDKDVVFEIDGRCGLPRAKINVHEANSVGSSNPQDVAVASDGSLWIPRYNTASLSVIAPCSEATRAIDLSAFDGDGNPNASALRIVRVAGIEKAFVALERLDDRDRLVSKQPSSMLRIDVATATVETVIELAGRNPFGRMAESQGALYLAEPGNFDAVDEPFAGIERFDTATSTSALVVREADIGASVAIVAIANGCGAAIVADATPGKNRTSVVTFDPTRGRALSTFAAPVYGPTDNYDLLALAWRGDSLLVGDRRRTPAGYAVHVFDRIGTCELAPRTDAIFLDLPALAFGTAP
jgi:hypothetical protein